MTYFLDHANDLIVGTWLGSAALGVYTKSMEYARYPRRLFAIPLMTVALPVFARLQDDRLHLSQSFVRVAGLVVRLAGAFSVTACFCIPYLVRLLLGPNWVPMIVPFQLLAVFTLLDPLVLECESLLLALGKTAQVARVRLWQLLGFIPLALVLPRLLGVAGAVLAADAMVIIGIILFLARARRQVDFSFTTLFAWPLVALAAAGLCGLLAGSAISNLARQGGHTGLLFQWLAFAGVAAATLGVYGLILWLRERQMIIAGIRELFQIWISKRYIKDGR